MIRRLSLTLSLVGLSWMGAAPAWAGPLEETFAGGARPALQDTLGRLGPWDPFATAANPAWALDSSAGGVSMAGLQPSLGARAQESSGVTLLQFAGSRAWNRKTLSLVGTLPVGSASLFDTGNPDVRIPFWTSRARVLSVRPATSLRLGNDWTLGVAVPVSFHMDSVAELLTQDGASTARLRGGLRPSLGFVLGATYCAEREFCASASYQEQQRPRIDSLVDGTIPLPGLGGIPVSFTGRSTYAFSPRRVTLQSSTRLTPDWTVGAMLRYSDWSAMPAPFLEITQSAPKILSLPVTWKARDTVELGVGTAAGLGAGFTAMSSYRFQPSPMNGGDGFYDRNQHVVALGLAWTRTASFDQIYLSSRCHLLEGGGLYTWFGIGLGSLL
jgi:hypothetical protein